MANFEKNTLNIPLRVNLSLGVVFACFSVIALRLWYLQVINGDSFRDRSENNRLQTIFIPPPRGIIKDRNGEVLVTNRPSFNIELIAEDTPDEKKTVTDLARLIGVPEDQLLTKLRTQRKRRKFEPKLLLKDVSRDIVAKVSAGRYTLPGVIISVVPARNYVKGSMAAHVLGYIREITQKQLESPKYPAAAYMLGDLVGQVGVESVWETFLQGQRGRHRVIVNATGTRVGELSSEPEVVGNSLVLTLDAKAQAAADNALADKKGAIVALDTRTGEVLALASSATFDPNMFTRELSAEDVKNLSQGRALMNRAIQGTYPPGSVYKVFMSIAALEEKVISKSDRVTCPGYLHFAGRDYKCHKKTGHGSVDLRSALVQSCDVYYYTVGQRLGVDRIYQYATSFGLGRLTNIGFNDEKAGLIPSSEWKRRAFRNRGDQKWYPGETLSVAIGQGANTVTPLQVAVALSAAVNGGKVFQPQVIRSIISNDGRVVSGEDEFHPKVVRTLSLDPDVLQYVKEAMVGVVNDPRGTGHRAQLDKSLNITVGGKTGTAQVAGLQHGTKGELNDHAWFAGFAPAEDPHIAVVALAENGGHGGAAAAPLVKSVLEAYFGFVPPPPTPTPTATPTGTPKTGKTKPGRPTPSSAPTALPSPVSSPHPDGEEIAD